MAVTQMTYKESVTQDEHMKACEWLEAHLEDRSFVLDLADFKGMVEQVVSKMCTDDE